MINFTKGQLIQVKREHNHLGENDIATIEELYYKKTRMNSMNYEIKMVSIRFRFTGKTAQFRKTELIEYFEPYVPTTIEEKINTFFKPDHENQSILKRFFSWSSKLFKKK